MIIRTLAVTLRKVHLVQAPGEFALLDLLQEVGVAEPLGELDAAVAARRRRRLGDASQQRRRGRLRSLGEGVRDRVGLRHVKVDRPIVLVELLLMVMMR